MGPPYRFARAKRFWRCSDYASEERPFDARCGGRTYELFTTFLRCADVPRLAADAESRRGSRQVSESEAIDHASVHAPTRDVIVLLGSLAAIAAVTGLLRTLPDVSPTTVALALLLVVLGTATLARLRVALVVSVAAMLTLNFFFLPPVGTFTIADPQNWIALVRLPDGRRSSPATCRRRHRIGRARRSPAATK